MTTLKNNSAKKSVGVKCERRTNETKTRVCIRVSEKTERVGKRRGPAKYKWRS